MKLHLISAANSTTTSLLSLAFLNHLSMKTTDIVSSVTVLFDSFDEDVDLKGKAISVAYNISPNNKFFFKPEVGLMDWEIDIDLNLNNDVGSSIVNVIFGTIIEGQKFKAAMENHTSPFIGLKTGFLLWRNIFNIRKL